jgi:hypothetical protein
VLTVCDNVHDCRVLALTDQPPSTAKGESEALQLELLRRAGPGGGERLVLRQSARFSPHGFELDGKAAPALDHLPWRERTKVASWLPGDRSQQERVYQWALEDRAAIRTFLDRVRDAKVLSVMTSSSEASPTPLATSLLGLNAALLAVDEVQGRLGTTSAWIRRGEKPEAAVPPAELAPRAPQPPRPPALTRAEKRRILAAARKRVSKEDAVSPPRGEGEATGHEAAERDPPRLSSRRAS